MTSIPLDRLPSPALTDRQVYRLLCGATFVVFLVTVLIKRLVLSFRQPGQGSTKSILAEARDTGSSTLLFAFMG